MALPLIARPRRALRRPEASPNKHQDRVNFHNDKAFEPLPEDHPEANAVDINLASEDDSFGESLARLRPSLANKGPALVRRAFFDQVSPLSQAADLIPGFWERRFIGIQHEIGGAVGEPPPESGSPDQCFLQA